MKLLIIACSLLLSSALFATESIPTKTTDIQISADNADKNLERLSYYFGVIPVGAVTYANFTVTNTGDIPLYFRQARIAGPGYYASTNCNQVLPPRGGRCGFTIEYRPYFEGYSSGQFMMSFDNYTVVVDLSGQAVRY